MNVVYSPLVYKEPIQPCHITKEDVSDVVLYEDSKEVKAVLLAHIVFLKCHQTKFGLL